MLKDYPDTSNYQERPTRKPLDPGMYNLRVDNVQDEDKNGNAIKTKDGFDVVLVVFDVLDSDDGHKVFERIVLDDKYQYHEIQMSRLKQLLISTGLPVSGGRWEDLIGRKCRAMLKKNGEYNNIHFYETEDVPPSVDPQDRPQGEPEKDLPF